MPRDEADALSRGEARDLAVTRARLIALGGLNLIRSDGVSEGPGVRRRQLALLAMLAAAGERGLTRDQMMLRLWGDSIEGKARHSLDQAISEVRKSFGRDAVVRAGAGLRLNEAVIESDLAEFRAAIAAGDFDRAAGLYAGPLLEGFHLDEAPDFEDWMETERRSLGRAYIDLLATLARSASARGDHAVAARWWRRLSGEDRLSGLVAVELMRALVAAGDRAAALEHYRDHQGHVRRELKAEPDEIVETLVAKLRSESGTDASAPGTVAGVRGAAVERLLAHVREALHHVVLVDAPVARGALVFTYAARDRATLRPLVLKVVRPELTAMLRVGAVVSALQDLVRLRHPRLVPWFDAGVVEGLVWALLPMVAGETLRELLARDRQLALGPALRLGAEMAEGLAYAHAQQVEHLDLSPKRIFVGPGGAIVGELGLARAIRSAMLAGDMDTSGVIFGAAMCMSPEIVVGEVHVDGRADCYSLACLLYHALAGTAPVGGGLGNAQTMAMQRLTSRVTPIGELRDGIPQAAERAIMSALARSPADRPTMAEMHQALCAS